MGVSAYAMITAADGREIRAEDLAAGDSLRDPFTGRAVAVRKIWQGPGVGMVRIAAATGAVLDLTGDHPVATAAGMTPANRVTPGTGLSAAAGSALCTEAASLPGDYMVYDIVLEDSDARILAGGLLVAGR